MSYIFYYLTEDSGNMKERNEIDYLRTLGRVVIVTRGSTPGKNLGAGIKNLSLPIQSPAVATAYSIWTKICYLIARPSDSLTDRGFPSRNIYTGHAVVRWLINHLWPAKYFPVINRLLPDYETLYFAPFKLARLLVKDKHRSVTLFQRVVVHDSLILRLTRFTPFILAARRNGLQTIANVKSWDNPFYSQFARGANGYLTWSQSMWRDVQHFHKIKTAANHSWGPRPFFNFANALQHSDRRPNKSSDTLVLGYAAAFCDTLMAAHEVQVVAGIAKSLQAGGIDVKILFRPYPTMSIAIYEPLHSCPNVEIVDIQGPSLDRYGDGRELIRFGSDEERIQYLSRCHCFLSIATSFTFEAALFGLPVFQYFIPRKDRRTEHDMVFFERLDISDHILNYLLPHLPLAKNSSELSSLIQAFRKTPSLQSPPTKLLAVMGFPSEHVSWNERSGRFLEETQLA